MPPILAAMAPKLTLLLLAQLPSAAAQQPIAITHVTVIDGRDSLPRRDITVIVQDRRITTVGPAASVPVPTNARTIDGRGRFLIPGLWDMHVHADVPGSRAVLPLYVTNGVTGVRDMGGDWAALTALRDMVRAGTLAGPRMMLSGPYLDGNPQPIPHFRISTPEDAVAAVDSLARLGADLVKLHTGLTREAFLAALREARSKGLRTGAHVPRVVGAVMASDSGLGSLEHLLGIPVPCTPAESVALALRYPVQAAIGRCSSENLAPLIATLVRNGTRVVPTFSAQYEVALWPERKLPGDEFEHHVPDTLRRYVAGIFPMPDVPKGADSVGRAMFEKRLAQVGQLFRSGVVILPGTDAPLRNSPPGFGLHGELEWLVRAGLSPWEALRAATLEPARFLGLADSLGTIEPGKLADLVLLNRDPLRDIRNTRSIRVVVADGRLVVP